MRPLLAISALSTLCVADLAANVRKFLNGGQHGHSHEYLASTPIAPEQFGDEKTPIHLSVSAYQDGERCAKTIDWGFARAEHPDRISFGVLQARSEKDLDCVQLFRVERLPGLCKELVAKGQVAATEAACAVQILSRINNKQIELGEARGPAHQRSMQSELINFDRDDKYCVETDSHMDFLEKWDSLAIEDWNKVKNEFAVLTAYVMDLGAKENGYAHGSMVDCCGWSNDGDGMLRGNQCGDMARVDTPYLTMNWAAGFSFHRCHAERNVPIDHNLEWIFTGEEVDRAARLWTNGYDLYLPTRGFVLHNYSHANQGFWRAGNPFDIDKAAKASRAKLIEMGLSDGHSREHKESVGHYYPMGKQRTVEQYMEFSRPAINKKVQCRSLNLERVPVADPASLAASAKKPAAHEL